MKLPATPNGIFVTDVSVTKITKGFTVTFTPANCGHGFPLIGLCNTTTAFGSAAAGSDEVVYSSHGFSAGTSMSVTRGQSASASPGGVLQLGQDGKYTTGEWYFLCIITCVSPTYSKRCVKNALTQ